MNRRGFFGFVSGALAFLLPRRAPANQAWLEEIIDPTLPRFGGPAWLPELIDPRVRDFVICAGRLKPIANLFAGKCWPDDEPRDSAIGRMREEAAGALARGDLMLDDVPIALWPADLRQKIARGSQERNAVCRET